MTFVGDDEYDDIGGFANDEQDMNALDISKGLEPLQTTFRRAFFDGLKALSDENVDNYDDDDDENEQQHATPIAGAISLALTYANRIERDPSLRGRVKSSIGRSSVRRRRRTVRADDERHVRRAIEQHSHRLFMPE